MVSLQINTSSPGPPSESTMTDITSDTGIATPTSTTFPSSSGAKPLIAADPATLALHPVENGLLVKVQPPQQPKMATLHVPCDLVLVVDVSVSMQDDAPAPGQAEMNYGFSILDLTKHACLTILETLGEGDRLAIVTFSTTAKVLQELVPLNDEGKKISRERILGMEVEGATNLWHGIREGLKLFQGESGRVPAMLVLTDGMPNYMCPPMGYVPKLRQRDRILPTIHTFGFGYNLRSGLLKSIAEVGGGNYAFIPDSGMLGTVFIHAIANLQSTFANHAVLRLRYPATLTLVETATAGSVDQREPVTTYVGGKGITEMTIPLGNLQFGQSRDIYLAMRPTDSGAPPTDYIIDTVLDYQRMTDELFMVAESLSSRQATSSLPPDEIAYHVSRSSICNFISGLYPTGTDGEHICRPTSDVVDPAVVIPFIDALPIHPFSSSPNCEALLSDIRHDIEPQGQFAMALSTSHAFEKWGRHYLPSLQCAHEKQLCNSFKDPGPQVYASDSPLFKQCRDRLDEAFDNLTPPPPSNRDRTDSAPLILTNMRAWRDVSGVCFSGRTQVSLYGGGSCAFEDLRGGDVVLTMNGQRRRIAAIVKTRVVGCEVVEIQDVVVTTWHPISRDGAKWEFPADVPDATRRFFTGYVYSAMLERTKGNDGGSHGMEVGGVGSGIWGVTLGHGIVSGSDVRAHSFFGDYSAVEESLSRLDICGKGVFACGGVVRSLDGRVCGFERDDLVQPQPMEKQTEVIGPSQSEDGEKLKRDDPARKRSGSKNEAWAGWLNSTVAGTGLRRKPMNCLLPATVSPSSTHCSPPSMENTLSLLKGSISLDDALEEDIDIFRELSYPEKRFQFLLRLYSQRQQINEVVSRHLNIRQSDFRLGEVEEWIHGSFNACIPVYILRSPRTSDLPSRAIIRFPLPYKVGETFRRGNVDEKLRSEAATYIWMQQNCPHVPIPRLFGFGFPGKQSFTAVERRPFYSRALWTFRRAVSWICGYPLSPYVPHSRSHLDDLGYLVLKHIGNGKMLSETWGEHRHDPKRRANLFRDLSRVMLDLAKLPLPRIGSWTIDDRGVLKLANRPLTLLLHQLENAEIGTGIPRDRTYTSVEPYILDLIACHDNRLRYQPNAIHHQTDGEEQLAALTAMRALLPKFMDSPFRQGPFVYSLTDLHQSNIFVDEDWHVTNIIDLEWACSRPIEMLGPPGWLSDRSLEEITFHLSEYASLHDEFVDSVESEGLALYHTNFGAEVMRSCWKTGSFWYSRALDSPTTLLALYIDHLQPRFVKLSTAAWTEFSSMLMALWDLDSQHFVSSKVKEQEQYTEQLRDIFAKSPEDENNAETG